ncbi:response regulator, partial [Actinomyces bowdenii]|nr:response regulator [Actinomyces bowdenii]NYS70412.1 response regulator [Actinomyces bowdenii]
MSTVPGAEPQPGGNPPGATAVSGAIPVVRPTAAGGAPAPMTLTPAIPGIPA